MKARMAIAVALISLSQVTAGADFGLLIWRDPGVVESLDLRRGPGGEELAPRPPFTFEKEILSGITAKVKIKDGAGRGYVVKWGDESHAEVLASRLAWAAGYFTIPVYFVQRGEIGGAKNLRRAGKYLDHGAFTDAAFQLWEDDLIQTNGWEWNDNPFVARVPGARELNGLKILMMLTSNWDNKDAKDVTRGSNTAVLKVTEPAGQIRYEYMVFDWGGAMGAWGGFFEHSKWDCGGYARQSPSFIKGINGEKIEWGYRPAQYADDIIQGIALADVRWLMQYLGRLTDRQLMDAAAAAGATPEETACYAQAIRQRIEQLRGLAG